MNLEVTPSETRSYLPITVKVENGGTEPKVWVNRAGSSEAAKAFRVAIQADQGKWSGTFWVEEAGLYEVTSSANGALVTKVVTVRPQKFLSFGMEFGLTFLLLIGVLAGIALWVMKIRKRSSVHP